MRIASNFKIKLMENTLMNNLIETIISVNLRKFYHLIENLLFSSLILLSKFFSFNGLTVGKCVGYEDSTNTRMSVNCMK